MSSVNKLGALLFSVLMLTSMFVGVIALSPGTATAAPAGNFGPTITVSPDPVDEASTVSNFTANFTANVSADSSTDIINVTYPDDVTLNNVNGVASNISITSSPELVDGPDQDGNIDTVQFAVSPSGGGSVTAFFDVDVSATFPEVASDRSDPIDTQLNDSSLGTSSTTFSGAYTIQNAGALPDGATDNTENDIVAPGEQTVVANLTFAEAGNVSTVEVNLNGGTQAANITQDDVDNITVLLRNVTDDVTQDSNTVLYDSQPKNVSFSSANVTGVDQVVVLADTSEFNVENNDIIDATVKLQTNPANTFDTAGTQTIESDLDARLRGEVQFQNGTAAEDVLIQVVDIDTGQVLRDDIETRNSSEGQAGTWGAIVASPGNYTVELDDTGTETSDLLGEVAVFSTNVDLDRGETEKIETTLDPLAQPAVIEVDDVQGQVGDTLTFTATVFDGDGNRLEGAFVDVTGRSGSPIPTIVDNVTKTTDANGQVTFNVTATQISQTEFEFTAEKNGASADTTAVATFVQSGEGRIQGQVYNNQTTNTIEDATVWAVLGSSYEINTRSTRINLSNFSDFDNDGVGDTINDSVFWVRLVDNETGEIIDKDTYDVRATEQPNNDGTGIRKIEQLNKSALEEGSGFAVVDLDGDGVVRFNHTRLDPREYRVQVSLNAGNASDNRLAEDRNVTEAFVNVTGLTVFGDVTEVSDTVGQFNNGNPADNPEVYAPGANLTLERTKELAQLGGTNLVDAPGFINTAGIDTDGTNENGDFQLNRLFTNFSEGRTYVVIATKAGFSTDFADVFTSEDGDLEFSEVPGQEQGALVLDPAPVEPAVNITNIARLNNASQAPTSAADPTAYSQFYFSNQTDLFNQPVPRDGSSIDVILVETTDDRTGQAINDSVTLEVPDSEVSDESLNFGGDFIAVAGGTELAGDGDDDTIRIATGADGQAIVWLQTDLSGSTFEGVPATGDQPVCSAGQEIDLFSGVTAQSNSDLTATDASCKLFGGVTQFASINGLVTDEDNDPIANATVWVDEFELTGKNTRVTIERLSNGSYNVTVFDTGTFPDTTVESQVVSGDALRDYKFSEDFSGSTVQNRGLEPVDNTRGFTLLTNSREQADNLGEYTLPRVPAEDDGNDYQLEAREQTQGLRGQGDARQLEAGRTDDAGIVIPFALGTDFQVQNLQAPATATAGDTISVTADVENIGAEAGQATVEFRLDLDGDGTLESDEVVATQTTEPLSGNETVTVTFDIDTTGIAPDTYDHGVFTAGDSETAQITLEEAQSSLADRFDADDDGEIDREELFTAIDAFQNGNLDRTVLFDIIDEFQSGNDDSERLWADV